MDYKCADILIQKLDEQRKEEILCDVEINATSKVQL